MIQKSKAHARALSLKGSLASTLLLSLMASALSMSAIISLSLISSATAFASASFSDLDGSDPSYDAIQYMESTGTVEGYPDGSFQSTSKINRAEFVKILIETIVEEPTGENCFSDVTTEWFAAPICNAKELGIIEGYPEGDFRPGDYINFAEASKVIAKAFELNLYNSDDQDEWYRTYVEPIANQSAIPFSISDFDKEILRGEMAEVIWRLDTQPEDLTSLVYEELQGIPVSIDSCSEFEDLYVSNRTKKNYYGDDDDDDDDIAFEESVDADVAYTTAASSDDESGSDFSTTNIQEIGVDESDIVKNNGSHLYMIDGDEVKILDLFPAEDMAQIATLDYTESGQDLHSLYLDGDTLIVLLTDYDYSRGRLTLVDRYDISDPAAPELERTLNFEGELSTSRKVDNTLYLVMQHNDNYLPYYEADEDYSSAEIIEDFIPHYIDSLESDTEQFTMAGCEDISYLPRYRDFNYLIAAAVPTDSNGEVDFEVMIGDAENVYASTTSLYVAETNYSEEETFYLDWNNTKTLIHRFSLGEDDVEYEASGKIPGTIHNQFSMSEHEGHLRAATTTGDLWSGDSSNHLYVLDENMDITGSVEDLAEGESIYSARMFGARGYIVTFKKVDPLFVLNLEDPTNPYVEGELKIPGYSEYLHPFGEDYLIGFGKDAEEAEDEETEARNRDFAWYQGLKVSLFDITDVNDPQQIASMQIGDRGSESNLLFDHKALTASLDTDNLEGFLAFPVLVAELENPEEAEANDYGDYTFQGLMVLDISVENGFSERGRISHFDSESEDEDAYYYSYYYGDQEIHRSLYIDDALYAVSDGTVSAHDLETLEDIASVDIVTEDYNDWWWDEEW
jgi:inhibitor of cysteine peptidase